MRGYTTPPYMFLLPANGPRSSSTTERPARASAIAAHDAGGPGADDDRVDVSHRRAPRRRGSACERGRGRSFASRDDREVGELHHRTVRIGVDADDVLGRPEAARVLHGAADPERDVQAWVDDDTGRADLALVADPAAVGDHPRRADAGAEQGGDRRRAASNRSAASSPAPPPTIRGASARSIVAASGSSTSSTTAIGDAPPRSTVAPPRCCVDRRRRRLDAARPGLQRRDERAGRCERSASALPPLTGDDHLVVRTTTTAPACSGRSSAAASRGARSRPSADAGSTTIALVGEQRRERCGPRSRAGSRRPRPRVTVPAELPAASWVPLPITSARPPHSAAASAPPAAAGRRAQGRRRAHAARQDCHVGDHAGGPARPEVSSASDAGRRAGSRSAADAVPTIGSVRRPAVRAPALVDGRSRCRGGRSRSAR